MSLRASASPALPHDLFHSHIIPDILSDHLHRLLVDPEPPSWHAFYTLPLVSVSFFQTCQSLYFHIFGLANGEDGRMINIVLTRAQSLWFQAQLGTLADPHMDTYSYSNLMASRSLIQVYICFALACSYLNLDVMWYIQRENEEQNSIEVNGGCGPGWPRPRRRFRMPDNVMHRVYTPLTCAMKLCDTIQPERLVYTIAPYLADKVPFFSTAPVMLKYTQNLESYVAREHTIDMAVWVDWTLQTLGCIEGTPSLLEQMQNMGRIVKSFKTSSAIPRDVLKITKIMEALGDVMDADWGDYSEEVMECTLELLDKWA